MNFGAALSGDYCEGAASSLAEAVDWRAWLRCPWKKFPTPLNDPALFTASKEWQDFVRNDRYALREATARTLFASFALDFDAKRARKHVTMPVLLLLAGKVEAVEGGLRTFPYRP